MKADAYAYRDRRNRKRDFRRLWITRINAAARQNGMSYWHVHPRPQAGRHRARPQGARRHRRARPRDLPPICRRRPRGVGGLTPSTGRHHEHLTGAAPPRTAPFFVPDQTITSPPQPDKLKEIRKLAARRERARDGAASWPRARTCSRRPTRAGWRPVERCSRGGQRARRHEVEPGLLADASALGSGTRALGVYEQRWVAAPAGPLCVRCWGVARPGQRRHGAALARWPSAPARVALGPGCADPYGPKAVRASMGAIFAVPRRARGGARRPARRARRARRRARASRCRARPRTRRSSSAPSARGCPPTSSRRATASAHIPIASRVAERRDGGDRRAVRARLGCPAD